MGKVIALKLEDVGTGCRLIAFHKQGKKRRPKWVLDFDHRDSLAILAAIEEKEPRLVRPQPGS